MWREKTRKKKLDKKRKDDIADILKMEGRRIFHKNKNIRLFNQY
jgi:hypothetical protein